MRPGPKPDPEAAFRMYEHKVGAYTYAATHIFVRIDDKAEPVRRSKTWGRLDDKRVLHPNQDFMLLSPAERQRFIYPEDWDLSEVERLPSVRRAGRPAYLEVDRDRLYGHVWLLMQIAARLNLVRDLEIVFHGNRERARAVLSLAMFTIVTSKAFMHMREIQRLIWFPAVQVLTPSAITKLMERITEQERMELFRLREKRIAKNNVCAVDSTTRTGCGNALSDLAVGKGKDGQYHPQTVEVVVYSLTNHEPVYYKTFAGNLVDSRSLPFILKDLRDAGFRDLILVTDRGYESHPNLMLCIRKKQRLLTAAKVGQKKIRQVLGELLAQGDPVNHMEWLETDVYAKQYDWNIKITGKGGKEMQPEGLRLTLCLDMQRKTDELSQLHKRIRQQEEALKELKQKKAALSRKERNRFSFFKVTCNAETNVVEDFERREDKIRKARELCGFFAFITNGLEWSAEQVYETYRLRDEQEKYFYSMKTRLRADRQRSWSDAAVQGRRFIEFVALILLSYINHAWTTIPAIHKDFRSIDDIFTVMSRIRCVEHRHKARAITPFISRQARLCDALHLKIPDGCEPLYVKSGGPRRRKS